MKLIKHTGIAIAFTGVMILALAVYFKKSYFVLQMSVNSSQVSPKEDVTNLLQLRLRSSNEDYHEIRTEDVIFSIPSRLSVDIQDHGTGIRMFSRNFKGVTYSSNLIEESISLQDVFDIHVRDLSTVSIADRSDYLNDALECVELKKALAPTGPAKVAFRQSESLEVLLVIEPGFATIMWQTTDRGGGVSFAAINRDEADCSATEDAAQHVWFTMSQNR